MASTLEVIISARDQFTATANRVIGTLHRMQGAAGQVGRGVGQLGAGFARIAAIGATAAVGGLTAMAKAAIDFEDAFSGVKKTVNETDLGKAGLSFEALAKSFRTMATEIPIAATDFARVGEIAGTLGIRAQDIVAFSRTVALMGVTTDLTTEAAAEGMGKLGTILGLTGKQYEELADAIVALGNAGASSEPEIVELSKRFAASGRQAGLAKEEIVALASAAASLGIEPEAGGSALSRLFSNMATEIALATKKGKAFATITGDSLKMLTGKVRSGKSLEIFRDFLEAISKMDRIEAAKALEATGITNVRDRDAILKMSQNLAFFNEQIEIAKHATGAMGEEARKKFETAASKLRLLRNNLLEVAMVAGDEFKDAIGRAADKMTAFLKLPDTRAAFRKFGQDIGKAIDDINWRQVLDGAKTFVSLLREAAGFAKGILDALNALPTEVKAGGLAFLAANKLSGGLIGAGIGNIIGGITEGFSRALTSAGLGKMFPQPVIVMNWPPGFGLPGGAPPGAQPPGGSAVAPRIGAGFAMTAALHDLIYQREGETSSEYLARVTKGAFGKQQETLEQVRDRLGMTAEEFRNGTDQQTDELRRIRQLFVSGTAALKVVNAVDLAKSLRTEAKPPKWNDPKFRGGSEKDPFGALHLKSFAMGLVPKGRLKSELEGHIAYFAGEIEKALGRGDTETADKLQATKAGLEHLLEQVKTGTFRAGDRAYEGALSAGAEVVAQLRRMEAMPGAANNAFLYQHTLRENVNITISSRDVSTSVATSTAYGPTSSSYYGGSTAPAYSH